MSQPNLNPPEFGTDAYRWWRQGATDEHRVVREGMTDDGKQAWNCATTLAQRGDSALEIAEWLALVFTAGDRRARWRLAWKLIRR